MIRDILKYLKRKELKGKPIIDSEGIQKTSELVKLGKVVGTIHYLYIIVLIYNELYYLFSRLTVGLV